MKRADIISSLVIGEAAGLLMLVIGRNITLPSGAARVLPLLPFGFPIFTAVVMAVGSYVGGRIAVAYQFTKFLLVGGLNFLIDLGVLNLLVAATNVTEGYQVSIFKAVAFLVAVISSFLWNKFWTFRSLSTERAAMQFAEFLVITVIGFFINVGAFSLLNNVAGPQSGIDPKTWVSISAGSAAILGLVWNFLGYKLLVFRAPRV